MVDAGKLGRKSGAGFYDYWWQNGESLPRIRAGSELPLPSVQIPFSKPPDADEFFDSLRKSV